jgi:hypothetical protein
MEVDDDGPVGTFGRRVDIEHLLAGVGNVSCNFDLKR